MHAKRFEEAKSLFLKVVPAARRVLGDTHAITLGMRSNYAQTFYHADGATLGDLREAVSTLEETAPIARRVLGSANPTTAAIEASLQYARGALRARETPSSGRGKN